MRSPIWQRLPSATAPTRLEAAVADIAFRAGRFVIAGTDHTIGIMELAEKIRSSTRPMTKRANC
jgi:hypothetical protein